MAGKIAASIMCADLFNMDKEIRILEENEVDYLHLDIMDGNFVPNLTLGIDFVNCIKDISTIKRDIHLLVNNPENYIDMLQLDESDNISFHYEATQDIMDCITNIKKYNAKVGIVLNPETEIEVLEEHLDYIDMIVLMMIEPGFAGRKMLRGMFDKIKQTKEYINKRCRKNIMIEVDGNVSFDNAKIMRKSGGDIFVAGTSSIYRKGLDKCTAIKLLRESIQ